MTHSQSQSQSQSFITKKDTDFINTVESQIDIFYNKAKSYITDKNNSELSLALKNNKDVKLLQDEILVFRKDFQSANNIRIRIDYTDSVYRQYTNKKEARKRMRENYGKKSQTIEYVIYKLLDRISKRRVEGTQYIPIVSPSGNTISIAVGKSVGGSKRKSSNQK